jgi:organic hydroperoxide reductase OsmC/OhrA
MDAHYYHVDVNWQAGRKGTLCSPELSKENGPCLEVATPPEFSKGVSGVWSPEHLFTAAVNSCLMTTFLAIAENSKLNYDSFSCSAKGKLEQVEGKFMMSEVTLSPTLTIFDEKDEAIALRILEKSEAACLISNSVTSKIIMKPTIKTRTHEDVNV